MRVFGETNPPLTENLVSYIFSMNNAESLKAASLVNQAWRLSVKKLGVRKSIYESLLRKCDFFTTVTLYGFTIENLNGGWTNSTFKIVIHDQAYVARLPGRETHLFINRPSEYYNAKIASKCGINPAIIYFDPENGAQITSYLQDPRPMTPTTIKEPLHLQSVIETLRAIHQSHDMFDNDIDIFQRNRHMLNIISSHDNPLLPVYMELANAMDEIEFYITALKLPKRPCHNDTTSSNFVLSNSKIYLIDWEYSGNNFPIWDLVCKAVEADFAQEDIKRMLFLYYAQDASENEKIFQILIPVYEFWVAVWAGVQIANHNHCGNEQSLLELESRRLAGCRATLDSDIFKMNLDYFRQQYRVENIPSCSSSLLATVGLFPRQAKLAADKPAEKLSRKFDT